MDLNRMEEYQDQLLNERVINAREEWISQTDKNDRDFEELTNLSWGQQVDNIVHEIESADSRDSAQRAMFFATKLGFLIEYRPNKWQPVKGKKGKKAIKIIDAYHKLPTEYEVHKNRMAKSEEELRGQRGLINKLLAK